MALKDLRGKVCIVGASEADTIGSRPDASAMTLGLEAARNALADAGLTFKDVDGIFTAGLNSNQIGEMLGIVPRYTDGTMVGGCSFIIHVEHAMLALNAGMIDVALIVHGESGRSRIAGPTYGFQPQSTTGQFESVFGLTGAFSMFSFCATRHMHQFGTKREQMAELAVAQRKWAALHPKAVQKAPITVDDVMNARPICWPFTLLMCCLVEDMGGALVLTRADRAKSLRKPPVYVLGTGEATSHSQISMMRDMLTSDSAKKSSNAAFEMAGLKPKDMNVAELYDAFAITPLMALEDLGFVDPGEGGPFLEGQRTAPGGSFPLNTNGGGMSYGHSGMYGMYPMIELTRQLRGEGGARQVKNAKVGVAHGPGGIYAAAATLVAGREPNP
ncbi:MAG: thiolase [Chloroflexi bacterium]|nr:thiolase [Chloroflexota bacterium]